MKQYAHAGAVNFGKVKLNIRGQRLEQLLFDLAAAGIKLLTVQRINQNELQLIMDYTDALELRPYLRRTGCRMRSLSRTGMPKWRRTFRRNTSLVGGVVLFCLLFYVCSLWIWSVELIGEDAQKERVEILEAAEAIGIREWRFWPVMERQEILAMRLGQRLPFATWIGLDRKGAIYQIHYVGAKLEKDKDSPNPQHLIASKDAVITEYHVKSGQVLVHPHQHVLKGDILVSGILGGDSDTPQKVAAIGEVEGLVWYRSTIRMPKKVVSRSLTGEFYKRAKLNMGQLSIPIWGWRKTAYEHKLTRQHEHRLPSLMSRFPVSLSSITEWNVELNERNLQFEQTKEDVLSTAEQDLLSQLKPGAVVVHRHQLQEHIGEEHWHWVVLFEIEENIAEPFPIGL